jgi:hypothetical protein
MYTSLNSVPNAQVCVFDGTYYKITTTNYNSKTSLYITFRMYSLGPWLLKILMFALLVTREIATSGAGHAFPRQRHMRRGGPIYFCQGFLPFIMPSMNLRQDRWMDGSRDEKASLKTTTTSFTICNAYTLTHQSLHTPLLYTIANLLNYGQVAS